MAGKLVSDTKLPAYSIEDPMPVPDGCTISSILSPTWNFSDFSLEHNNTSNASYVTFLVSLGTGVPSNFGGAEPVAIAGGITPTPEPMGHMGHMNSVSSMAAPSSSDASAWSPCVFAEGVTPSAPSNCSFRYDSATGKLELKADWLCDDLDADRP